VHANNTLRSGDSTDPDEDEFGEEMDDEDAPEWSFEEEEPEPAPTPAPVAVAPVTQSPPETKKSAKRKVRDYLW
jgi:hypothetical protein